MSQDNDEDREYTNCQHCLGSMPADEVDGDGYCPGCADIATKHAAADEALGDAQSELDEAESDIDDIEAELAELKQRLVEAKARVKAASKAQIKAQACFDEIDAKLDAKAGSPA